MAWMCPYCKVSYQRRKDHDESKSNYKCKLEAIKVLSAEHAEIMARRKALENDTGQLDKECNRAWARLRRAQGW